jgi:plasmid stabilization system protein ParE
MTKIEFHPEARLDLESARSWYRERSKLAARAFITEVLRALRSIAISPDAWPRTRANERRFVLKRFPYSIIYRTRENEVFVTAIAHHRRLPEYWHERD